ncbi:hypothetical protein [Cupriavidus taiwanensis]|uniref:Uncharacterized protein n=1 Tax=Cupriavidus taiwanensis (strain DSM 17343 / BCRC 17206 / CCUG 44338 / CIP 107171 / LMG 19424 / R1) TaxID=977880 RepID=B3R9K6_CUPTR|nr:hypothetical protein [Cupriavidus taiwanensis]CAQ71581.1 conserved hypothetical protein [Cupriavidus taiwanensis LMG 19424]
MAKADPKLEAWLKSGKYLPEPLRDFHDQKEVFMAMHEIVNVEGNAMAARVDWISGQCYVIDIFLWFMARRGYTLQRSRAPVPFLDLEQTVSEQTAKREAHFTALLTGAMKGPS